MIGDICVRPKCRHEFTIGQQSCMQVVFVEERRQISGQTVIRRVRTNPDAKSAEAFLDQNAVTKEHYYLVVKTPEGTYCRDRTGNFNE